MNESSLSKIMSPEMIEETQRSFIVRVYGWMTFGLLVTAGAALLTLLNGKLLQAAMLKMWPLLILLFAELGLVIFLTAAINRISPLVAGIGFVGYAALNGVTLSLIFLVYAASSIFQTFVICACMFGIMSLFGYTTKRDLTAWGNLLFMGLIGLLVSMIIGFFFQSSLFYWLVTLIGIAIFVGLIAYDTQKLKKLSLVVGTEGDSSQKASIIGALELYLDFINLFLFLLRLFGKRN